MNTRVLSVRIDEALYTRCLQCRMSRRILVTKALNQYLNGDVGSNPVYTTVYNHEYVDLLQAQVMDLRHDKEYLQSQVNALMIVRTPLLQRVILKLRG